MKKRNSDLAAVEDAGVAFDPTTQSLSLSKEEKRRTTAILLATNAYKELIIREADMLREASDLARRGEGPKIQPATLEAIVDAAIRFDRFIATGNPDAKSDDIADEAEDAR